MSKKNCNFTYFYCFICRFLKYFWNTKNTVRLQKKKNNVCWYQESTTKNVSILSSFVYLGFLALYCRFKHGLLNINTLWKRQRWAVINISGICSVLQLLSSEIKHKSLKQTHIHSFIHSLRWDEAFLWTSSSISPPHCWETAHFCSFN